MKTLHPHQLEAVNAASLYLQKLKDKTPLLVMPTGSGKSVVIAEIAKRAAARNNKVLILTHTEELVDQNAKEAVEMMGAGVRCFYGGKNLAYQSNGKIENLPNKRARENAFTVDLATIQTYHTAMARDAIRSQYKLVIIDEAHRINNTRRGVYAHVLNKLKQNGARIIGLTATPYRLKQGHLTDGEFFDGVAYEVDVRYLIDKGFLCDVVTPQSELPTFDLSNLKLSSTGEYTQSSLDTVAREQLSTLRECLTDALHHAKDRNQLMVFAMSTAHIEPIKEILSSAGVSCESVDATTPRARRKQIVEDFRCKKFKCLINFGVFTTGFNVKSVDCVINFRPTQSPALYVQIVGRVMRIYAGKTNGLYIDYGGNIERHGAIDAVETPAPESHTVKEGKTKRKCKACSSEFSPRLQSCPSCGFVVEKVKNEKIEKLTLRASTSYILTPASHIIDGVRTKTEAIERVHAMVHPKQGSKSSIAMFYYSSKNPAAPLLTDYMHPNHGGFASTKSIATLKLFLDDEQLEHAKSKAADGDTFDLKSLCDALNLFAKNKIKAVRYFSDGKYKKIFTFIFDDDIEIIKPFEKLNAKRKLAHAPSATLSLA